MRRHTGAGRLVGALLAAAAACAPPPEGSERRHFHHTSGISFDHPAAWQVHDATAVFDGGSVIAVLGTVPVPPRCGTGHVDINCYHEQPLPPGTISVVVGTGSFGGATLFDPRAPDAREVARARVEVGGLPAIEHRYGAGDSYDEAVGWEIAFPRSVLQAYVVEARLRGPGLPAMRRELDALIASVSVDGTGPPLAGTPDAAVHTGLAELDRRLRRGHVARPEHTTWYSCYSPAAGVTAERVISLGPTGPLERLRTVTCRWTAAPEGARFWRVTLELDGRARETLWLTGDGTVAGSRRD
ncbi:MAG TPA: hypothetical protein VNO26_14145 [Candidatus Limnocylindria bacterium]|nr:hypothetical protein [Candidatus Limnocylindria bacterium]